MGRHAVTAGRRARPAPLVKTAYDRVRALLAAGELIETNYDLAYGNPSERTFYQAVLAGEYRELVHGEWPCEAELEDAGRVLYRDDRTGVFVFPDKSLVVYVSIGGGWLHMTAASTDREAAGACVSAFSAQYPALYRQESNENRVAMTYWTLGRFGPQSRLRMIEAASWEDVKPNYSADVQGELDRLMSAEFKPGDGGQLILWQGPPGTGKTWALRALASEWSPWAEFSYVTDPDNFFVTDPSYMIDVLLHDSYEEMAVFEDGTSDVVTEQKGDKWRVLVLEDTGELLAADSKEQYGQGLSRVLNVVDGLVGQGLRVLVLVTTNDELGELHPAVQRPGRCASSIVFAPLSVEEANAWMIANLSPKEMPLPVEEPKTIAELYVYTGGASDPIPERDHPDDPEPEEAIDLMASGVVDQEQFLAALEEANGLVSAACGALGVPRQVIYQLRHDDEEFARAWDSTSERVKDRIVADVTAAATGDTVAALREVAGKHAPQGGYGETAWRESDGQVFWNAADWTSGDEVDAAVAALEAVPGVSEVDYDFEVGMDGTCPASEGWELVWPEQGTRGGGTRSEGASIDDIAALANEPLPQLAPDDDLTPPQFVRGDTTPLTADINDALQMLAASGDARQEALVAALKSVADLHEVTMSTVRQVIVASAAQESPTIKPDVLTMAAISALEKAVTRPDPVPAVAPDVHVHVPPQDVHVQVDGATVNVPEPAPVQVDVHVPEQPTPNITIEQPAAAEREMTFSPHIDVHVPAQAPAEVTVNMPDRGPRRIKVEFDEDGNKTFVEQDADDELDVE